MSVSPGNGRIAFVLAVLLALSMSFACFNIPIVSGDSPSPLSSYVEGMEEDFGKMGTFSQTVPTSAWPSAFSTGDLNNDSRPDIVVASAMNDLIEIFEQQENGSYPQEPSITIHLDGDPTGIDIGDIDGDGLDDIILCVASENEVYFGYQTDGFTLTAAPNMPYRSPYGVKLGDFDNDSLMDFAVISHNETMPYNCSYSIYLGAAGYWGNVHSLEGVGLYDVSKILIHDCDGDGKEDLVIWDGTFDKVMVVKNENQDPGDDLWSTLQVLDVDGPSDIGFYQVDSAGQEEMVISAQGSDEARILKYNEGTSRFDPWKIKSGLVDPSTVCMMDVDDDDVLDLVITDNGDTLVKFFSTSLQGAYGNVMDQFPSHASPLDSEILDFDLDGIDDLLVGCNATLTNGSFTIYYGMDNGSPSNADGNVIFEIGGPTSMIMADMDRDGENEIGTLIEGEDLVAFNDIDSDALGTKDTGQGLHDMLVIDLSGGDDLLISNGNDQDLNVYWGGVSFYSDTTPSMSIPLEFPSPNSLAAGDVDGDGVEDVLVGSLGGWEIFFGNSTEPYLDVNNSLSVQLVGCNLTEVLLGDLDVGSEMANGWNSTQDVAVINKTSNRVEIYFNLGGDEPYDPGYFKSLSPTGSGNIVWMEAGLIDDDELLDLAIGTDDGNITIFFQDLGYNMGFDEWDSTVLEMRDGVSTASLGDIDDDGFSEIAVMGSIVPVVSIVEVGLVGPIPLINLTSGSGYGAVEILDVDGDQRDDVLFSSPGSGCISYSLQRNMAPVAVAEILGPSEISEGEGVSFFGGNSTDSISDISSLEFNWDFGDSSTGDGEVTIHHFMDDGEFTVTLRVADRGGLENETTINITIGDLGPEALFDSPSSAEEGSTLQFTDLSSSYPDGLAIWEWEYGDGASQTILAGNDPNVTHTYDGDGTYLVNLTVTDDDGSWDSYQKMVTITDLGPSCGFDVSDNSPREGETVTFTSTSTSHPDMILNWTWDFGDGEMGYGAEVEHVFETDELYMITLQVTDEDGSTDSHQSTISVEDIPPEAGLGFAPLHPDEGDTVRFSDLSTSFHPLENWTWSFGDGDISYEREPQHIYQTEGEYLVNLTVMDVDGSVNTSSKLITVMDSLIAEMFVNPSTTKEGEEITFRDTSWSYNTIINWTWDMGDGTVSYLEEPSHTYLDNGTYNVVLRVRTSDGSEAECDAMVMVMDTSPSIDSLHTQSGYTEVVEDTRLQFRVSCIEGNDPIVRYEWDLDRHGIFETDNITTTNSLSARFTDEGVYYVTVRVWDSDSYAQAQLTIEVINLDPEVELAYNVIDSGTIHFFASYYNDSDSDMGSLLFQWAFGGEYGDMVETPEMDHHFEVDGVYTVRLKVIDDNDATGVSTQTVVVDRTPPRISAVNMVDSAYVGDLISVSFDVNDSFDINTVTLHYSIQEKENSVEMTHQGEGGVYIASIPPQNSTGTIDLWVVATDSSNNTGQTGVMTVQVKEAPLPLDLYIIGLTGSFALVGGAFFMARRRYLIDDVFIIYQDGCLISHESRRIRPGLDDDLLSSMLIAIQEFVMDSFKDEEETGIRRLDFGQKKIMVEKGNNVYMAVVLHGNGGEKVQQRMQQVLENIEKEYDNVLRTWDGDLEGVRGIKERSRELLNPGLMNGMFSGGKVNEEDDLAEGEREH